MDEPCRTLKTQHFDQIEILNLVPSFNKTEKCANVVLKVTDTENIKYTMEMENVFSSTISVSKLIPWNVDISVTM